MNAVKRILCFVVAIMLLCISSALASSYAS